MKIGLQLLITGKFDFLKNVIYNIDRINEVTYSLALYVVTAVISFSCIAYQC